MFICSSYLLELKSNLLLSLSRRLGRFISAENLLWTTELLGTTHYHLQRSKCHLSNGWMNRLTAISCWISENQTCARSSSKNVRILVDKFSSWRYREVQYNFTTHHFLHNSIVSSMNFGSPGITSCVLKHFCPALLEILTIYYWEACESDISSLLLEDPSRSNGLLHSKLFLKLYVDYCPSSLNRMIDKFCKEHAISQVLIPCCFCKAIYLNSFPQIQCILLMLLQLSNLYPTCFTKRARTVFWIWGDLDIKTIDHYDRSSIFDRPML